MSRLLPRKRTIRRTRDYTSASALLANSPAPGDRYRLIDRFGNEVLTGQINADGSWNPHPLRSPTPIPLGMLSADPVYGYEVTSGILQLDPTTPIANGGTGHSVSDPVYVRGGLLKWGSYTMGVQAQFVVSEIDGGGAGPGVVTGLTPAAGRAGHGDYLIVPDVSGPVATDSDAVGTPMDITLNLNVLATGVTVTGDGALNCAVKNATGLAGLVMVRFPAMSDDGTWYFPQSVEGFYTLGALTQLTYDTTDTELSSFVAMRLDQTVGTPDQATDWEAAIANADVVGDSRWRGGVQAGSSLAQANDGTDFPTGGERRSLSILPLQRQVATYPLLQGEYLDRDTEGAPRLGGHFFADTASPWAFDSATPHLANQCEVFFVVRAGISADDEFDVTLTHVLGTDQGRSKNP